MRRGRSLIALWLLAACAGTLEDPGAFLEGQTTGGSSTAGGATASASGGESGGGSSGGATAGEGTSGGATAGGTTTGGGTTGGVPSCDPTYIFEDVCIQCHNAADVFGGVNLQADNIPYLVDYVGTACTKMVLVPGSPETSLLYLMVANSSWAGGASPCPGGTQMPELPDTPLDAGAQQCIYDWIANYPGN